MKRTIYTTLLTICLSATSIICMAEQPKRALGVPVAATVEITHEEFDQDGDLILEVESTRFFRDALGRTRTEKGNTICINDPFKRHTLITNVDDNTMIPIAWSPEEKQSSDVETRDSPSSPQAHISELGPNVIEGVAVTGLRYVITIPTSDSSSADRIIEVWYSEQLQLPILTTLTDPQLGKFVTAYKNLQINPKLDTVLFEAPKDAKLLLAREDIK